MPFTTEQVEQLLHPINPSRVLRDGKGHAHVSQQDVLAHLIRVFGFGAFDTEVLQAECVFEAERTGNAGRYDVCYRALVRLTVRDPQGVELCHYENGSTATAQNQTRGDAHDLAYKGLALDTPIPTPTGWTTMGLVEAGDHVFDRDGQPVLVLGTSEIKHQPCYRVTLHNGSSLVCDEDHMWVATVAQEREKVHGIAAMYAAKAAGKRVVMPLPAPLQLPEVALPLDPWFVGYWLGNGSSGSASVTCHGDDVGEVTSSIAAAGYQIGTVTRYEDRNAGTVRVLNVRKVMAEMGILGDKNVPESYLRGSFTQRLALLRGLMDSDGSADRKSGRTVFVSTTEHLARAAYELARSLGEHPTITPYAAHGFGLTVAAWSVSWRPTVTPFTLARKVEKVRMRVKVGRLIIKSIEKVDSAPTRCIAVDSPTQTFLAGRDMVPTHNSAISLSVKRAAIALGDQFGLSLYNKGQMGALVMGTLVGRDKPQGSRDMQAGVPQQVSLGNDEIDSEPDPPPAEPPPPPVTRTMSRKPKGESEPMITKAQSAALHASFNGAGVTERDARLAYCHNLIRRDITFSSELTRAEASRCIDALHQDAQDGTEGEAS